MIYLFSLIFLIYCSFAHTWWDTGHMIVAETAYRNLTPAAQIQADALLQEDFVEASCYADDVKEETHFFDSWHYITYPYDPEGILTGEEIQIIQAQNQNNNVVWAIEQSIQTLSNEKATPATKAFALKFLIHLVGDVHLPVHVCSQFSKNHPDGDIGGNLFTISGMDVPNLHQLWDSGIGAFPKDSRDRAAITRYTDKLLAEFPKDSFSAIADLNPTHWSLESFALGRSVAYNLREGEKPSEKYLEAAERVAKERAVLAGYRLAAVLNMILDAKPFPPDIKKP